MQPMNYTIDVKNPFETALNGAQAAIGISNAMDAEKAKQYDLARRQQMSTDANALAANPAPTASDYANFITKYPEHADHYQKAWGMLSDQQQKTSLSDSTQVFAALNAGQPDIATGLLDDKATALKNSGRDGEAKHYEVMSKLIKINPNLPRDQIGMMLFSNLGPEQFNKTFASLAKLPSEVRKGEADATKAEAEAAMTPQRLALENQLKAGQIRDIDSNIATRSGQLGLDKDKLQSEVELKLYELRNKNTTLDDGAKKLVNDSTIAAVAADQSASQMLNLAGQLEKTGAGYGGAASAAEWLKKATGNQDAISMMRQEYTRIRSGQVAKLLPPGPASDKDIALAMAGFPPDTADAVSMASFLRGMAKLTSYDAANNEAKAEWINSVGHLGRAKTDIEVGGIAVPAGSNYLDFAKQYLGKKAEQRTNSAQLPTRSYMRYATPGGE